MITRVGDLSRPVCIGRVDIHRIKTMELATTTNDA
jgi:hypothetical protein